MITSSEWLQLTLVLAGTADTTNPVVIQWREDVLQILSLMNYESDRCSSDGRPLDEAALSGVVHKAIADIERIGWQGGNSPHN